MKNKKLEHNKKINKSDSSLLSRFLEQKIETDRKEKARKDEKYQERNKNEI